MNITMTRERWRELATEAIAGLTALAVIPMLAEWLLQPSPAISLEWFVVASFVALALNGLSLFGMFVGVIPPYNYWRAGLYWVGVMSFLFALIAQPNMIFIFFEGALAVSLPRDLWKNRDKHTPLNLQRSVLIPALVILAISIAGAYVIVQNFPVGPNSELQWRFSWIFMFVAGTAVYLALKALAWGWIQGTGTNIFFIGVVSTFLLMTSSLYQYTFTGLALNAFMFCASVILLLISLIRGK